MKAAAVLAFAALGLSALCASEPPAQEIRPALALAKADPAAKSLKPVRTYRDVLAVIPKDLEPEDARHWSAAQKEVANGLLKKKLVDTQRPARMRFKVHGVDSWQTMTVWSELPADEGYAIRVFVGLWKDADFLPKLATLKPGDLIEMTGICDRMIFEDLWNTASLSICLREGAFTKLLPNGKPAPPPAQTPIKLLSAVYGSGDKFADVTDRVRALFNEPGATFSARPCWLGADPTPGWNKALVIIHETNGQRRLFSTGEGGEVSAALLVKQP